MATLADRLDACQETLIDLYEKDSNKLEDQIKHWHCIRLENAILFKARQAGLTHLGHQVVPTLNVTKGKAHQAIAVHLSLQSLYASEYKDEPWTLQNTSLDMWNTQPKGCWKKKGRTVTVKYDCEDSKKMEYVNWGHIYVQSTHTEQWHRVHGQVSYDGLYYELEGHKQYYVQFAQEATKYGEHNKWEVHWGNTVIYEPCNSVSSTQDTLREVSPAEAADRLLHAPEPATSTQHVGTAKTTKAPVQAPPCKRQRVNRDGVRQPNTAPPNIWVDNNKSGADGYPHSTETRNFSDGDTAPVIHLRGDANKLKCLRYRLRSSVPDLFVNASSTWHWTCGEATQKCAFVTIWYANEEQRAKFLQRVTIPKGIQAMQGFMSMCL